LGHASAYLLDRDYPLSGLRALLQVVAQQIALAYDDSQSVYQITDKRTRKLDRPTLTSVQT
jgi:hypothetical protein